MKPVLAFGTEAIPDIAGIRCLYDLDLALSGDEAAEVQE